MNCGFFQIGPQLSSRFCPLYTLDAADKAFTRETNPSILPFFCLHSECHSILEYESILYAQKNTGSEKCEGMGMDGRNAPVIFTDCFKKNQTGI